MSTMRTTLRLDDDLLLELKNRASEEGLTLSEVVNLALAPPVALLAVIFRRKLGIGKLSEMRDAVLVGRQ